MTDFLVKRFVKDYENVKNQSVRRRYGMLGGITGIILNVLLFAGKFTAGILASSIAVTADAFNNLSDAGASVVSLVGFKMSGKPADNEHPFGHGRIEYVSGLFIALLIMLMGVELAKTSFDKLIHPQEIKVEIVSIVILVTSILVKLWMSLFNRKLGNRIDSSAMRATASDSRNDCIATTAVLIGVLVCRFSGLQLDGIIGLCVAVFILFSGASTAKETLDQLLGEAPAQELVNEIKATVMAHEEIIGIHDLIVHNYGPGRTIMSLHAEVPCDCDLMKIHDEIDLIEQELKSRFDCIAVIHMDPIAVNDERTQTLSAQVGVAVRAIDPKLSIHDFRAVFGETHTNLIFDVVMPYTMKMSEQELAKRVDEAVKKLNVKYNAVIEIDRDVVYSDE